MTGEFNFLVIGRYNVGKSTLINTMFLRERRAKESQDAKPCTRKVECYRAPMSTLENNLTLKIYDTPGLQDGTMDDRSYLSHIDKECGKFHLVIYCTEMVGAVRPSEIETLRKLATALKSDIWNHLIIALTRANEVEPPHAEQDDEQHFKQELDNKINCLCDAFKKINLEKVFNDVISKRVYPVGSGRKIKLPITVDWRPDFLAGCQQACKGGEGGALLCFSYKYYPYIKGAVIGAGVTGGAVTVSYFVGPTAFVVGCAKAVGSVVTGGKAVAAVGRALSFIGGGVGAFLGRPVEIKAEQDKDKQKKND